MDTVTTNSVSAEKLVVQTPKGSVQPTTTSASKSPKKRKKTLASEEGATSRKKVCTESNVGLKQPPGVKRATSTAPGSKPSPSPKKTSPAAFSFLPKQTSSAVTKPSVPSSPHEKTPTTPIMHPDDSSSDESVDSDDESYVLNPRVEQMLLKSHHDNLVANAEAIAAPLSFPAQATTQKPPTSSSTTVFCDIFASGVGEQFHPSPSISLLALVDMIIPQNPIDPALATSQRSIYANAMFTSMMAEHVPSPTICDHDVATFCIDMFSIYSNIRALCAWLTSNTNANYWLLDSSRSSSSLKTLCPDALLASLLLSGENHYGYVSPHHHQQQQQHTESIVNLKGQKNHASTSASTTFASGASYVAVLQFALWNMLIYHPRHTMPDISAEQMGPFYADSFERTKRAWSLVTAVFCDIQTSAFFQVVSARESEVLPHALQVPGHDPTDDDRWKVSPPPPASSLQAEPRPLTKLAFPVLNGVTRPTLLCHHQHLQSPSKNATPAHLKSTLNAEGDRPPFVWVVFSSIPSQALLLSLATATSLSSCIARIKATGGDDNVMFANRSQLVPTTVSVRFDCMKLLSKRPLFAAFDTWPANSTCPKATVMPSSHADCSNNTAKSTVVAFEISRGGGGVSTNDTSRLASSSAAVISLRNTTVSPQKSGGGGDHHPFGFFATPSSPAGSISPECGDVLASSSYCTHHLAGTTMSPLPSSATTSTFHRHIIDSLEIGDASFEARLLAATPKIRRSFIHQLSTALPGSAARKHLMNTFNDQTSLFSWRLSAESAKVDVSCDAARRATMLVYCAHDNPYGHLVAPLRENDPQCDATNTRLSPLHFWFSEPGDKSVLGVYEDVLPASPDLRALTLSSLTWVARFTDGAMVSAQKFIT